MQALDEHPIIHVSMRHTSERAEHFMRNVNRQCSSELSSGYEGLAQHMHAYPIFTPQETDTAIRAYRSGMNISQLAHIAPFQEKLASEEATRSIHHNSTLRPSYQLLFTERRLDGKPITIPDMVALTNHDLIVQWINAYASMFRDLALPLDDFYNTALSDLLPHEARTYDPAIVPESFRSWASRMLFWRLHGVAQKRARELRSLPAEIKPTHTTAFKDSSRRSILSLDAPLQTTHTDETPPRYADTLASPQPAHTSLETNASLAYLFSLAGLTPEEQQALVMVAINEDTNREAGESMRRTERTIRNYRDRAIAKLLKVGDHKTLWAILQGDEEGTHTGALDASDQTKREQSSGQQQTEQPIAHACLACGKAVPQPARKQSRAKFYCNSTCRTTAYRERHSEAPKETPCPHCTTPFIPKKQKGKVQKYCQDACRLQANWQKRAEKRKQQRHEARAARKAGGAVR